MKENRLWDELSDSQREAVMYVDGPSMVIAGAGSGKTRVLTYKIAYLLGLGVNPWNVLALTFTNKAAAEMKNRIANLVDEEAALRLNMGTFHSIFARILRYEAAKIGFEANFTIYDENDSRSLLKTIVKEQGLDDKTYKAGKVHARISMAKNHLIDARRYADDGEIVRRDIESRMPALSSIYGAYAARLRQANAMDFDDLLLNTFLLFSENPDVCEKYRQRFRWILVDEYQDTNLAQQRIIRQLVGLSHKPDREDGAGEGSPTLCVVGDDAQSIYAFRGANIDNMLDFESQYAGSKIFKLEENYRSTQRIVEAANSLIAHNERQIRKDVFSHNAEGERVMVRRAYSDKEEALIVCSDIRRIMREERVGYDDFAILYRTNAQSRAFEEQLRKQNIPYRVFGGLSFYQRKEIKDVLAYFRLVTNEHDEEAFRRIVNYPARGIGSVTLAKLTQAAQRHGVSLFEAITHEGSAISPSALRSLSRFHALIASFAARLEETDAYQLGRDIIRQVGIGADLYGDTSAEGLSRQENLEEFLSMMQDFVESRREEGRENEVGLAHFLQEVSLLTDIDDTDDEKDKNEEGDRGRGGRVSLMTIHSAKGLEFSTVFVVGLEENVFPSTLALGSRREMEEERRLLYVAMTRARTHCILTHARNRYRYGKMEFNPESRFFHDIDPRLLDTAPNAVSRESGRHLAPFHKTVQSNVGIRPLPSRGIVDEGRTSVPGRMQTANRSLVSVSSFTKPGLSSSSSESSQSSGNLVAGDMIEHQRFGIGKVLALEGSGENTKATVLFQNAGKKQLLLKFARFSRITQ